jgi:prolipoprotein diacylglyceryl transferase
MFHLYGFFVGLGVAVAILMVEWVWKREKILANFNSLALIVVVSALVGARLYHLMTDWQLYQHASFWDLISVWNGGIGIIGALMGAGIALVCSLFFQKKLSEIFPILDALAVSLPFAQAIGRWGNYVNQELYGRATNLPWGIKIDAIHLLPGLDSSARYHPLFFYESVMMFLCGSVLFYLYQHQKKVQFGKGLFFAMYGIWYAVVRFFLEFFRADSRGKLFTDSFSPTQELCIPVLILLFFFSFFNFLFH